MKLQVSKTVLTKQIQNYEWNTTQKVLHVICYLYPLT